MIHTDLPREEAAPFGSHMDLIFREYTKRFSVLRGQERGKQNLYLLRTRQGYIDTLGKMGINAQASGGMFFINQNYSGLATWVEGLPISQVYNTLQHEGFHQFAAAKLGPQTPIWINEGLAEYFGEAIIVDGQVRLGVVPSRRLLKLREAIEADQAIPFAEVLKLDSATWRRNMLSGSPRGSLQYAQSWSIVHFLVHGDDGKYQRRFEGYLKLLSRGRTHADAFEQAFGRDVEEAFAKRWIEFVEEVKPDAYSTALGNMRFLAHGMLFLHEADKPMPDDIDALKTQLSEIGFNITYSSEGTTYNLSAKDDSIYSYEDRGGEAMEFVVLAPAKTPEGSPPRLSAPGLRPTPTIEWDAIEDGGWSPRVEYR